MAAVSGYAVVDGPELTLLDALHGVLFSRHLGMFSCKSSTEITKASFLKRICKLSLPDFACIKCIRVFELNMQTCNFLLCMHAWFAATKLKSDWRIWPWSLAISFFLYW